MTGRSRHRLFGPALLGVVATVGLSVAAEIPAATPVPQESTEINAFFSGYLTAVDYVHRSGQFRLPTGELFDFTLPPEGGIHYEGGEVDLREIPLGALLNFACRDKPTGLSVRPGLIFDSIMNPPFADKSIAEKQRQKFAEFTKARGIAGRILSTDASSLTIELFTGDVANFKKQWLPEFTVGKDCKVCVANDELRTWNPPVDGERGTITQLDVVTPEEPGHSGVRLTFKVTNMLEGFRRGRIVRVFGPGWKVQDQPYGESLMGYGFGRLLNQELVYNVAKEFPEQFPFRTDYGNEHLPWYKLTPENLAGTADLPPFAEHVVYGSLVEVDAAQGRGKFLTERTGEPVEFTLLKKHVLKSVGKSPRFAELPLHQRYRFHTYQDAAGKFTVVGTIQDDYSYLSGNYETYRITEVVAQPQDGKPGRLYAARQIPKVKDYNGDMQRPADFGALELLYDTSTKVTRDGVPATLADLQIGGMLLVNRSAELPGKPSLCTEIWLGDDDDKLLGIQPKK
ncbi:MAG: hypothetical protein QM775_11520 [Pirellulales bacterium]